MLNSKNRKFFIMSKTMGFVLTILLCLSYAIPVFAFDIPKPTDAFYVNDTVDLLDSESKNYIVAANEDLYAKTGAQIVVVTISSLDGASIEEYSTELFRSYGIGDSDKNNGILILLSTDDRECRIEVGYGLEGAINDAKAGRIMDQCMIPFFKDNNWVEGIVNGFDAVLDEVCNEYDVEISHNEPRVFESEEDESNRYNWIGVMAGAIGLVGGLIIGRVFASKALIPSIALLVTELVGLCKMVPIGYAIMAFILVIVAFIIGIAITYPENSGSSKGSYHSSGSYRSSYDRDRRYSSSSSSSSRNYGGGGRSGGGGASRKF